MNAWTIRLALLAGAACACQPLSEAADPTAYFSILQSEDSGPPYLNANPIVVALLEDDGAGSLEQTATFSTNVSASSISGPPPLLLVAVGQGMPPGPAHSSVVYNLYYAGPAGDLTPGTFFDVSIQFLVQGQPGTTPEIDLSQLLLPDDTLVASCNMGGHKAGGGGTGVGRVGGKMHLEDVGMSLTDSAALNHPNAAFDIAFRLYSTGASPIDVNQPLARITFTAQSIPEPTAVALSAVATMACLAARRKRAMR